jgi:hypothetical protein
MSDDDPTVAELKETIERLEDEAWRNVGRWDDGYAEGYADGQADGQGALEDVERGLLTVDEALTDLRDKFKAAQGDMRITW